MLCVMNSPGQLLVSMFCKEVPGKDSSHPGEMTASPEHPPTLESEQTGGYTDLDENSFAYEEMALQTAMEKTRKGRSSHYFPKTKKLARAAILDELKMDCVIRSYMSRGHQAALIDPLHIVRKPSPRPEFPPRVVIRQRRVPVDREIKYLLPSDTMLGHGRFRIVLGDLVKKLNDAYCSTIGVELHHIHNDECRKWICDRIETTDLRFTTKGQRIYCAKKLIEVSEIAAFMETNSESTQRYSISGSETSPLGLDLLIQRAAKKYGARVFVIGMRRLARFSVLSTLGFNQAEIFKLMNTTIAGMKEKLHLGTIFEAPAASLNDNTVLRYIMAASPAIPQSFFPITLGLTKGIQQKENDPDGLKVWPILIHMARGLNAQGITYETLKLSALPQFNTHGTIHLVFNNQMEQTLRREVSMQTEYSTDVLKVINAPIFHVNGDDVDAVHFVCRMAADFRARFNRDVVIDIVSYQRTMASRTQTKYEFVLVQEGINQTPPSVPTYLRKLIKDQIVTKSQIDFWRAQVGQKLSQTWHEALHVREDVNMSMWTSQMYLDKIKMLEKSRKSKFDTGIEKEKLLRICKKISAEPPNFRITEAQQEILQKRAKLVEMDSLDWILCEALAYGSLLLDLNNLRITGMDVNRRMHIIQEYEKDGKTYNLLDNISETQGRFNVCKSTTSQYATAGFEYGYSTADLDTLVVWEAPEGDKTSKAQVIIDHFIAAGYEKYNYHSNIIFLLPHYFDCKNPSVVCNGRPERFLQLVQDFETATEPNEEVQMKNTNMILVNASTPANLFHVIRRQMYLQYRRPLVIFAPNLKSPHIGCKSKLSDISVGTRFQPFIPDENKDYIGIKKVLFCTGNIYYDLIAERKKRGLENKVTISRIEQISPLPYNMLVENLKRYVTIPSMAWVQEEPINQGWFNYLEPRLLNLPNITRIDCIARPARADGGSRSMRACLQEQHLIYEKAFALP